MAIGVVAQKSCTIRAVSTDTKTGSTALLPAVPTGTQDGDLLIAIQSIRGSGTAAAMTAPAGWSVVNGAAGSATFGFMKVWQKYANGESGNLSFPKDAAGVITVFAISQHDSRPDPATDDGEVTDRYRSVTSLRRGHLRRLR